MNTQASKFWFLLRREMWEHKAAIVYLPIALAVGFLILQLLIQISSSGHMEFAFEQNFEWQGEPPVVFNNNGNPAQDGMPNFVMGDGVKIFLVAFSGLIIFIATFVSYIYALGSLYTDRKDRSILFWKSLPIGEGGQYLSKLIFASLVIPGCALAASLIYMLLSSLFWTTGMATSDHYTWLSAWREINVFSVIVDYLVLSPIMMVTAIPGLTWFMFAAAFSKRSPALFALLIPFVIICTELLVFNSNHCGRFIVDAFRLYFIDNIFSFLSPKSWTEMMGWGSLSVFIPSITQVTKMVVLMAACVPAAIWLRNHRYEI